MIFLLRCVCVCVCPLSAVFFGLSSKQCPGFLAPQFCGAGWQLFSAEFFWICAWVGFGGLVQFGLVLDLCVGRFCRFRSFSSFVVEVCFPFVLLFCCGGFAEELGFRTSPGSSSHCPSRATPIDSRVMSRSQPRGCLVCFSGFGFGLFLLVWWLWLWLGSFASFGPLALEGPPTVAQKKGATTGGATCQWHDEPKWV